MATKTLLRVPELITAVEPLVGIDVTHDDIFRLIGDGAIKPFGYVQRMPVFDLSQIAYIAQKLKSSEANDDE
jgi:hypothetical protein